MNDSRFLSFRRHEKTNQIHIHFHIFVFPPILQIPTTGSNRVPDAPITAWRRSRQYVPTQIAIRRDAVDGTSGRSGRHVIRDKDARDSGQLLHFGDFFCIFALSFIKNGKWEINH